MARLWGCLHLANQKTGNKWGPYICVKDVRDEQAVDRDPVTPRANHVHSGGDQSKATRQEPRPEGPTLHLSASNIMRFRSLFLHCSSRQLSRYLLFLLFSAILVL